MAARSAVVDLQNALRLERDQSDAAARQASDNAHFHRFAACFSARPTSHAKA